MCRSPTESSFTKNDNQALRLCRKVISRFINDPRQLLRIIVTGNYRNTMAG